MKPLFTLLLVLSTTTASLAQMKDRHAERPGSAEPAALQLENLTRQMSNQLHLNEAQYIRLRALNRVKLARVEELQWQYHDDPVQRNSKLAELEALYEKECSRIFTPSQLSLFREEQKRDSVPAQPASTSDGGLG